MHWLLITDSAPAAHAAMQSAQIHMPRVTPELICAVPQPYTADIIDSYDILLSRFLCSSIDLQDSFKTQVLQAVGRLHGDFGNMEPMTMITSDRQLFRRRVDLRDAWSILRTEEVSGLALGLDNQLSNTCLIPPPHFERHEPHAQTPYSTWQWNSSPDPYASWFRLGTVYRTHDLLSALYRNQWDSPTTLLAALQGDVAQRRRLVACLDEAAIIDRPVEVKAATAMYRSNQIFDLAHLTETGEVRWQFYEEN